MSFSPSLFPDEAAAAVPASLSVNDVLKQWPSMVGPLNAFGIDTCCRGDATLAEAAVDAGVPLDELRAAVARAASEAR